MQPMAESRFRIDNLVSALVGGAAGGLLVWYLAPTTAQSTPTADDTVTQAVATALPGEQSPSPRGPEGERIEKLERSLKSLQQRMTAQAKVDAIEEAEPGAEAEGKRVTLSASDPKFENAVRAVLDKAKWEAQQEERDQRDEEMDKRIAREVDDLVDALDLSDDQADQVEVVLRARGERFRALREGDDRPLTRNDWREKFAEIQAETNKKLAGVLDAEQLKAYEKRQEEQWGPWGGRPTNGAQ